MLFSFTFNVICVLLLNSAYTVSLRDGLLLLLIYPLHHFYTLYSKCHKKVMISFVDAKLTFSADDNHQTTPTW